MTQQKSENRTVPKGARKRSPTKGVENPRGGKAVPVIQQVQQPMLRFATAENPSNEGATVRAKAGPPVRAKRVVPKAKRKRGRAAPVTMRAICNELEDAFNAVRSNKGAPGPDKQTIEEVELHFYEILLTLREDLMQGKYVPGEIRRVWIPKSGGAQRGLGIPNVVDRMVQEAVRRVLEPHYEPTFHTSSHGFRPGRSCHTAVKEAMSHLQQGYEITVDIDLEKFFDRVCHQRLMSKLAQRIIDKEVLRLIGKMLKAQVIMPDGVKVKTERGVPQGGPLSPLLSNIVLDEMDWELDKRGHHFVRYADDVNVYVKSLRAGQRVMANLKTWIENRLRLTINVEKSAVSQPEERHFLGFALVPGKGSEEGKIKLSKQTIKKLKKRLIELTPRNWGGSMRSAIKRISKYLTGWFGFFGICDASEGWKLRGIEARMRRRLRAIKLKQWKRKRTIVRKLIALGVFYKTVWHKIYEGRKSLWALSLVSVVNKGLRNAYFAKRGLVLPSDLLEERHSQIVAPKQRELWG